MVVILAGVCCAAACGGSGTSTAGGPPAPSTGGTAPGAGGADPGTGGADPGSGGTTPAAGGTTPAAGGATSAAGGATSAAGGATSAAGGATSASGGATSAAGGTTSGSGGTTSGSGGVDSGVGGSGVDAPAELPIDSTGWVASDSNLWGIQGAWYWFSDASGGGLTELDGVTQDTAPYVDGSGMCLSGTTPGGGADDYMTWGASIGLDLNYDDAAATSLPFDAAAAGIAGFDITITGSAPGGLLVKFPSANPMPTGDEAPSVALEEGTNHVLITDATVPSWAPNAGEVGDPSSVAAIQIQAQAGETGGTIEFCVTSIVPFGPEGTGGTGGASSGAGGSTSGTGGETSGTGGESSGTGGTTSGTTSCANSNECDADQVCVYDVDGNGTCITGSAQPCADNPTCIKDMGFLSVSNNSEGDTCQQAGDCGVDDGHIVGICVDASGDGADRRCVPICQYADDPENFACATHPDLGVRSDCGRANARIFVAWTKISQCTDSTLSSLTCTTVAPASSVDGDLEWTFDCIRDATTCSTVLLGCFTGNTSSNPDATMSSDEFHEARVASGTDWVYTEGGASGIGDQCSTDCDCGHCNYCENATCYYGGEGPYGCYRGCS